MGSLNNVIYIQFDSTYYYCFVVVIAYDDDGVDTVYCYNDPCFVVSVADILKLAVRFA